jgi:homoserine O-acetyltransferase
MEPEKSLKDSIGIVKPQDFTFGTASDPLILESGKTIFPVTVRYETYGTLNKEKSNAILILHAFSGDAHVAGYKSSRDRLPGWWDSMVGPGKPFDTDTYFIICSNVLGGCQGTTGPSSLNPETQEPYALSFPLITIGDMVKVQSYLIDYLGISQLLCVTGGSMGGMQALEWAIAYPERVRSAIVIASTPRLTAQGIAFNAVGRNAITSDPNWNGGNYYGKSIPSRGLAIARMIRHITYLSEQSMHEKFGRRLQNREQYEFNFDDQFAVESYLEYQGDKFVERFDANSYIYLSKAMDYFNLDEKYGSLQAAFRRTLAKFLLISFTSDWLYPPSQSKEMVFSLMKEGKDVSYAELDCPYGHDSFLIETERQGKLIASFLETIYAH